MAASREVLFLNGWRGGLNISIPTQQLRAEETPDCLNVVFNDRGGFTSRRGWRTIGDPDDALDGAYALLPTETRVIFSTDSGHLGLYNGATFTETADVLTEDPTKRPVARQYNGVAYVVNCYDGSDLLKTRRIALNNTVTTLGQTWNNDYTAPTTGNMPLARVCAAHNGHFWVADTYEGSTRHPSRVRFSHLGQPESWAESDYFELDPTDDRDGITAMLPFRDELLVFKRSGVYAVGGWDRDSFYQRMVSPSAGVCADTAVTSSSGIAYWISNDGNVFAYNGEKPVPIGDPIAALWRDGEVQCSARGIAVWARGNLYCQLDTQTTNHALFTYTPDMVGRGGMWARADFKPTSMVYWQRGSGEDQLVMTMPNQPYVFDFMNETQYVDRIDDETFRIDAYLVTHWMTGGETASRKRWRRPRITAGASQPSHIRVRVFRNFDEESYVKTVFFSVGATGTDLMEWDVDDWDDAEWVGGGQDYTFTRLSSLGSAYAVQLRITSPDNPERWWVDSIAVPFRRKQIR